MKRKIIALITCLSILLMCLCGCSGTEDNTVENTKGTREDPYKVGETINFTASYEGEDIDVTIIINKTILSEETIKNLYRDNNIIPNVYDHALVKLIFTCNGNYSDSINLEELVFPVEVTTDMREDACYGTIRDKDMNSISNVYTGANYELYEGSKEFEPNEYRYLRFEYKNSDGEKCSIWAEVR